MSWVRWVWAHCPLFWGVFTACLPHVGASAALPAFGPLCLMFPADKALRFSAVVNAAFHTESLIVESLCVFPPFLP